MTDAFAKKIKEDGDVPDWKKERKTVKRKLVGGGVATTPSCVLRNINTKGRKL